MKRKVIKQGNGTLTITLPKQWTKDMNLTGNDEVDTIINENNLVISPLSVGKKKSISINVDDFERLSLAKFLMACYEQGFDDMDLRFSKLKIKSWSHADEDIIKVINFYVNRLIGFEVLSQTKTSIKIGDISQQYMKFDTILSRIFFLIEEYLKDLITAMRSKDHNDLKNGELRHDNITKLISLASRIVHDSKTFSKFEVSNLFIILNLLDKITDFIRYSYRYTAKLNKVSKETIIFANKTFEFIEMYRSFFNKFDYKSIHLLDDLRGNIKKLFLTNANKFPKESVINAQFDALVEILHGAIKPRIAIELTKKSYA